MKHFVQDNSINDLLDSLLSQPVGLQAQRRPSRDEAIANRDREQAKLAASRAKADAEARQREADSVKLLAAQEAEATRLIGEARVAAELRRLEAALCSSGLARFAAGNPLPSKSPEGGGSLGDIAAKLESQIKETQAKIARNQAELSAIEDQAKLSIAGKPSPAKLAACRNVMGGDPMTRALASGAFDPPAN
jgi:hypothetical protein